ncbi:hypothetical protein EIN_033960, partial [Entamoeba invadens IP1]
MSRFADILHNDFIETISDIGLAEHDDNLDVMCFLEEDKRIEIITITLESLKNSSNLTEINCKGKMLWVLSTLADVFVFSKTERSILRTAEMYEKWLMENETQRPKYMSENYVECAKLILGQLTLPFVNCKVEEREVENHADYCLKVVDIYYNVLDTKYGDELNSWILDCLYGVFVPVFGFFNGDDDAVKRKDNSQYKYYTYLLKRLVNIFHLCLLKKSDVKSQIWYVFMSNAFEWNSDAEVVEQWVATTLSLQQAYMEHILHPKSSKPVVKFMKNCGMEVSIEIEENTLQTMWLSFIKISNVDYSKMGFTCAEIFQEGISLLMHDLSCYLNDKELTVQPPDGNVILDLYGDAATLPIFMLSDKDEFIEAVKISIGNICSFFAETLPTTEFEPKYIKLLINIIQTALSSHSFFVVRSCLDNIQNVLNYPLSGLTLSLESIYSAIDSILENAKTETNIKKLMSAWVYRGFIRTLNNSLVHYNVFTNLRKTNKEIRNVEPLLCTLLLKLFKTDLVDNENVTTLCSLITTFLVSFLPKTLPTQPIVNDPNSPVVASVSHLAWKISECVRGFSKDIPVTKLQPCFGIFYTISKFKKFVPDTEISFGEDVIQLLISAFKKHIIQDGSENIPESFVNLLLYTLNEYISDSKELQQYYLKQVFESLASVVNSYPKSLQIFQQVQLLTSRFSSTQILSPTREDVVAILKCTERKFVNQWQTPKDHIRIIGKNGTIYSFVDLPQIDKTQLRCQIIKRSPTGKFSFESSIDYVETNGQTVYCAKEEVKSNFKGDKVVDGIPLFCTYSELISKKPKVAPNNVQCFKSLINMNLPGEENSVFSHNLGSRLYHACVFGIDRDEVSLNVSEELFDDLEKLDKLRATLHAHALIDFPPAVKMSQFFTSFVMGIGDYYEPNSLIDTDVKRFISIQTYEGNIICECPELFKTQKGEKYDLQVIWNCTQTYTPTVLSKNVIIITPVSCNTFRLVSKESNTIINDCYVSGDSMKRVFSSFAFKLFAQDFNMFIGPMAERRKLIDEIIEKHRYKNGGRGLAIFTQPVAQAIDKCIVVDEFGWEPAKTVVAPLRQTASTNKITLTPQVAMLVESIKKKPSPNCPYFHCEAEDVQTEKMQFQMAQSLRCCEKEDPFYYRRSKTLYSLRTQTKLAKHSLRRLS